MNKLVERAMPAGMALVRLLLAARLYRPARSAADAIGGLLPSSKAREQRMLSLYGAFVQSGDLVFDIGANVGNRTRTFRQLGARVVAVEPQKFCVQRLQARFSSDKLVSIVPSALGRVAGTATMRTSQAHVISSLSAAWLSRVQETHRFAAHNWDRVEHVTVTTMDSLIAEFGRPVFCKVDVEGFESEVLAGLSTELPALSFECTPEYLSNTMKCIDRLGQLGDYEYNFNLSETMKLELDEWVDAIRIRDVIQEIDSRTFADIYARQRRPPAGYKAGLQAVQTA